MFCCCFSCCHSWFNFTRLCRRFWRLLHGSGNFLKWLSGWPSGRQLDYLDIAEDKARRHFARRHYHRRQRQVLALPEVATASARRVIIVGVVGISEFSTLSALFIIIANFHIIMRGRIRRQAASLPPPLASSPLVSSCSSRQLVAIAASWQLSFSSVELSYLFKQRADHKY